MQFHPYSPAVFPLLRRVDPKDFVFLFDGIIDDLEVAGVSGLALQGSGLLCWHAGRQGFGRLLAIHGRGDGDGDGNPFRDDSHRVLARPLIVVPRLGDYKVQLGKMLVAPGFNILA